MADVHRESAGKAAHLEARPRLPLAATKPDTTELAPKQGREPKRGLARILGSIVSVDPAGVGIVRRSEMFDDDDVDAFVAIRAGVWAGADDLPCTIWGEFDAPTVARLLDIIPLDDPDAV